MSNEVACSNTYCQYHRKHPDVALSGDCIHKHPFITITGECQTYWLSVARGESEDIRKVPLRKDPRLVPMYGTRKK